MSRTTKKAVRRQAYKAGVWGERIAAMVLLLKGYRIVHFRRRTGVGEIDLIVRRARVLVFVEVKNRKGGAKADVIHPAQASRLVRAGALFLAQNPKFCGLDVRFDVILTGGLSWPQHIKSAWQADSEANTAVF